MKIETQRSPILLNSEVLDLLRERGAGSKDQFSRATHTEKSALEYLLDVCGTRRVERSAVADFKAAATQLGLASAEIVQMINVQPTTAVEVHLIVEEIENRFGEGTDDLVEQLLALVQKHFPPDGNGK